MSSERKRGRGGAARGWTLGAAALAATALGSQAAPKLQLGNASEAGKTTLGYNRDIRPILAENCFPCHGPDSAARKAGLRLDRAGDAFAQRPGGAAIVPGDPVASAIVQRIARPDNDPLRMPPVAGHKSLTEAQRMTLMRWIGEGARYELHWSYQPPRRPALPAVKNVAWVRNPIDRFILARIEAAGLTPAPEADRRTLARRLSLDLTGLPPEPVDVERFVADTRPDAYERLVDRFLASPQWGEHRGRYWLDAARYADTHGIHFDNYREMWSYRDWVIDAFNRNLPFDRFTIEQLAGDLLPDPTLDQRIATGFNRCNITTNEGGAIDEEYKVLYTRDRTETAAQIWLGTTAGCAVCHDHKFDPLPQREFYALSAFFNNTTQNAMDGNIKDTPPILFVPMPEDRSRWEKVVRERDAARKVAEARKSAARPPFDAWLAGSAKPTITVPGDGMKLRALLGEGEGGQIAATVNGAATTVAVEPAPGWDAGQVAPKAFVRRGASAAVLPAVGDFEKDQSFSAAAWVKLPGNAGGAILARMDEASDYRGWDLWIEGNRVGSHLIHKWPDDALKVVSRDPIPAGQWHHVAVTYSGGGNKAALQVYIDGKAQATDTQADQLKSTIRTATPFKIGQRSNGAGVEGAAIQDVRVYDRRLTPAEVDQLAHGTRAAYLIERGGALNPAEKDELFGWWLTGEDTEYRALAAKVGALESEELGIRSRGTVAHVSQEKAEAPMAYILYRGEYDKRRDPVAAATPSVLPKMPDSFPKNRLGLAKWLLLPDHPLTTRVTVNRFWQEVFGTGLVKTSGDFGVTGEVPSHPELLDWLAIEFREKGWDIKKFFKLIVTSATYRQAALLTPEKRRLDPGNRLLSRGARYRMDGEMIRDYALASSGLLVRKLGGPSVRPYQPEGVWEAVAMPGSNTRDYRRDSGESLYRRSLYTFWKRAAPPASMEIFNAPNRETCVVKRERTDTPLQALVALNDIQLVEAARNLAQRALRTPDPIDTIARRVLSRPLTPGERVIVEFTLADLKTSYAAHPDDAAALLGFGESMPDKGLNPQQLAAWTMLVNQMLNLDEALNK